MGWASEWMTLPRIFVLLLGTTSYGCRARVAERVAEGVTPTPAATSSSAVDRPLVEVAVTVDDLPVHGSKTPVMDPMAIAERLISSFDRHRVPSVYGFVNGKRVADDPSTEAILRRWREA